MFDEQFSEQELRYAAKRNGLTLRKLRRQDRYMLIDPVLQICIFGHKPEPFSATLHEIGQFLEAHEAVTEEA